MAKLNIVLYEPEIPANTGNIGRTCVATGTRLHLIEPLGFRLNEKQIKRAGMDYWKDLDVTTYVNYQEFLEKNPGAKIYMATTKGQNVYTEVSYEEDCYIMFGKESAGIPEEILAHNKDRCVRIPMLSEIRSLNLLTEESVPEDTACLMINSPATDISEDEKNAILEYLENGGKAMIFSDYTEESMENFDAVLENYGVERADGIVIEGDAQHYAMQMPYYIVPEVKSAEPVSGFASEGYFVLAPYAQGIRKLDSVRDTVTIDSILTTSDSAYSKADLNSETLEKTEEDIAGPFDLGVSITETLKDDKQTQIIYYSTANLMDSQINAAVAGGNEQLIMESLNWMCSSDEAETVSIPSKSLQVTALTPTAYDVSFWKICTMGLIPGVFLVIGFCVWLKRRKA